MFHKILDCVSDTAAAEMRTAYKVGFKDGAFDKRGSGINAIIDQQH